MTNREKYFLKRDEYDTMMTILSCIRQHKSINKTWCVSDDVRYNYDLDPRPFATYLKEESKHFVCPIDVVAGKRPQFCVIKENILYFDIGIFEDDVLNCKGCIQQWLNEESEG